MSNNETPRARQLATAALLRERVLGALRATAGTMTVGDLCGMSGISELYTKLLLPQKVAAQVAALCKSGEAVKVERGQYTMSNAQRATEKQMATEPGRMQHLQLTVHKADKMVSFVFEGLQITVKVLP